MSDSPNRTLVVSADLTLETDDARIDIRTADGTLFIESNDVGGLVALYRLRTALRNTSERWLVAGENVLADSNVVFNSPVVVSIDGVVFATYTPDSTVGLLGRLLGGIPVRIQPSGIVRTIRSHLRTTVSRWREAGGR